MSISHTLNHILIARKITPAGLADSLKVTTKTVLNWIRGIQSPSPFNVITIARLFPEKEFEIMDSLLRKQYSTRDAMTVNTVLDPYTFSTELNRFTTTGGWWAKDRKKSDFDKEIMDYIVELKSKNYKSNQIFQPNNEQIKSQLIALPAPKILVINDWKYIVKEISDRNKELNALSWFKFQEFVAYLLEKFGWKIKNLGITKDDGIDLIATQILLPDITFNMMVQCKKYSPHRKVGLSIVKEVWSTKWKHGFHKAMIATTSYFTKGARTEAENWNFDLRDHDNIVEWCKKVGKEY